MSETPRIILHNNETEPLARWLTTKHPEADFRTCNSYAALPALIDSYRPDIVYSVRFAGSPNFPRDALFGQHGPRWLANGGAGTDHFGQWNTAQTTVTNAAGVAADMMAEYVFGGFLHFTLDVPGLQKDKADRRWNARRVTPLSGKTLLIIGLGHTGRAIATRAKAFGMTILGVCARTQATKHVDEVHGASALLSLLPHADFIAISTPLVPATRDLIGPQEIAAMKPGVVLSDVSRGGVVDQTALGAALETGHVTGAAFDVFEEEPLPASNPLWQHENLLISPHCSSVYEGWEKASFDLFLQNLARWMQGETLVNIVDPKRGY